MYMVKHATRLINMDTLRIHSLWYEGEYTMVYVIVWDFDVWVEYGTFKIKGNHKHEDVLAMLIQDSELLECVE